MSRWVNNFENHPFHNNWLLSKEELAKIDKSEITDDNALIELARIEKAVEYIDNYLKIVDPDINITKIANLQHMNTYASGLKDDFINFNSSKSINFLQNANTNIDNTLAQVKALSTVLPKVTGKSISSMLKNYNDTLATGLKEIDLNTTISNSNEIRKLKEELLIDNENQDSIKTQIMNAHSDIENKYGAIKEFYNNTLNENEYDDTLFALIKKASDETFEANKTAKEELTELTSKIEKFEEYYVKVFGELNEEDVRVGGLKSEVNSQKARLDKFETDQQEKHNKILQTKLDELQTYETNTKDRYTKMYEQIESLLPGATSAGLAEAYHTERKKFTEPIRTWNKVFMGSLVMMFIATFITFITFTSTKTGWSVSFADVKGIEETINNLFYKLPLYGPLIWLALYAGKRRSENQRLEQEYVHKEALARSYSSYKQQIDELKQEDEALLKKLLDCSINTVSKNASETLDKKHGDGMPSTDVIEKLSNFIEKSADVVKKAKGS